MGVAITLSTIVHATVLFGVTFALPIPRPGNLTPPLEVVLVNSKSATKPHQADALAQAHLDGGGNTDANRRAKSPFPVLPKEQRNVDLVEARQKVEQLEEEAKKLMTQARAKQSLQPPEARPERIQDAPAARADAKDLIQRSLEIARLEAQITKDWDSYQKRPKRRFIGARTEEYRFARYVEDWRIKIERIGNLNYPEDAKRQKIYGSLQLTVSIKADGSVESVEINRSSGQKVLDSAAMRIVKLAAPFAPFPADIQRDTDILSITRTWMFTRSDQLVSE